MKFCKWKLGLFLAIMVWTLTACGTSETTVAYPTTPDEAIARLTVQNQAYVDAEENPGDISAELRAETVENGQNPYAVVLTCSDSRVVPEHIFMEGINALFTIRNAGNIVDDTVLGSVEYGAEHLGTQVVLVLGHTNCGAVDATIGGGGHGYIATITETIALAIGNEEEHRAAEILNLQNSMDRLMESEVLVHLVEEGQLKIIGGVYDAETGEVAFLDYVPAAKEPSE